MSAVDLASGAPRCAHRCCLARSRPRCWLRGEITQRAFGQSETREAVERGTEIDSRTGVRIPAPPPAQEATLGRCFLIRRMGVCLCAFHGGIRRDAARGRCWLSAENLQETDEGLCAHGRRPQARLSQAFPGHRQPTAQPSIGDRAAGPNDATCTSDFCPPGFLTRRAHETMRVSSLLKLFARIKCDNVCKALGNPPWALHFYFY